MPKKIMSVSGGLMRPITQTAITGASIVGVIAAITGLLYLLAVGL